MLFLENKDSEEAVLRLMGMMSSEPFTDLAAHDREEMTSFLISQMGTDSANGEKVRASAAGYCLCLCRSMLQEGWRSVCSALLGVLLPRGAKFPPALAIPRFLPGRNMPCYAS